jgi:hypothetical protein
VLKHEYPVGNPKANAPPLPFSDNDRYDGDLEHRHDIEVTGDRFSLAALFRSDAGVGALCIDERDYRLVKLLRTASDEALCGSLRDSADQSFGRPCPKPPFW